jgi:hypothetical protein
MVWTIIALGVESNTINPDMGTDDPGTGDEVVPPFVTVDSLEKDADSVSRNIETVPAAALDF